jgi:phosphopentomutase
VFQIAAHEGVIPLKEQYRICEIAREMLNDDHFLVGRVIARPFEGVSGAYKRTENRKDYAVEPFTDTVLDALVKRGKDVVGIGKIEDIFCHRGVSTVDHTKNNHTGIEATVRFLEEGKGDFIFTNLVDFDMLYGHRNDVEGYASALEYFDAALPRIMNAMAEDDILMITADHGCDPTTASTDHSREYIPLVVIGKLVKENVNLGTRKTFADIGATVLDYITGEKWNVGTSFLGEIYEA